MSSTVLFYLFMCAINLWCFITAAPGDFGLITAENSIYNISMDTQVIVKFPITGLSFPAGIDYDSTNNKVYWTEYLSNRIGRCDLNGENQQHNFITNTIQPYGLVIDTSAQLLYWSAETTSGDSVLEKSKLDGSQRSVIANLGSALLRHITLDTLQNKLYWTDQRNHGIRRINTDGSSLPETVVDAATDTRIHGITLDIQAGLIFWCDWGKDSIQMFNLATAQSSTVYQASSDISPYALALYEQDIYWVESTLATLQRIPRTGLSQGQSPQAFGTFSVPFTSARGIRIVTSVCSNVVCRNGGTCLSQPSGADLFTCQCTTSYLGRLCETLKSECDTPTLSPNVFISGVTSIGATITFVCTGGYELIGASQATCRPDLTWSNESPTCVQTCSAITPPTNGAINPSTGPYLAGHPLTFTCNPGYYLVGLVTILCDDQGVWSSTNYPSCSRIVQNCPALRQLQNGYISGSFERGSTITFICNDGFDLAGPDRITCGENLQWSENPPNCVPVCARPILHENVFISTSFFPVGSMVIFVCPERFTIIGASQATCTADFTWSVDSPTCARTCPALTPPLNGAISPTTTPYLVGVQVTFTCNTGYHRLGLGTISCTDSGMWSSTNYPECSEIVATCEQPVAPQNGNFLPVQPSYNVDQVVTFQCDNGYKLAGLAFSATCKDDGTWSSSTPICQTVNCAKPTAPYQGTIRPDQPAYAVGQIINFVCNTGYQISDGQQSSAECLQGGVWSSETNSCTEITCLQPAHPSSGTLNPALTTYVYGQHVIFYCNGGFQLVGEKMLTCVTQNTWSYPSPQCKAVSCIPPAQPVNGNVEPGLSSFVYQQQVTFSCNSGYHLVGEESSTCIAINTWSTAVPTCQEITCAGPAQPQNGGVANQLSSYAFGQVVSFTCNDGYYLIGTRTSTCTGPNMWTPPAPSCEDIRCTAPPQPVNGRISPSLTSYIYQQEVTYTCDIGHIIIGVKTIRCIGVNEWSTVFPTCQAITCNPPASFQNGQVTPSLLSYTYNQEIAFRCNDGYEAIGSSSARCVQLNEWSNMPPTCQELAKCNTPITPINGNLNPPALSYQIGDVVTFTCNTNHRLTGTEMVTCLENGVWSDTTPTCQVITCPPLTPPTNGQISPALGSYNIDHQVVITCNNNYQLVGTSVLYCIFDGTWSSNVPICQEIICTAPTAPLNGFVSPTQSRNPIGTVLSFTCQTGFQLSGVASITCTESGTWSSPFPRCVQTAPTTCTVPPQISNGNMSPSVSSYQIGITITYTCSDGYNLIGTSMLECTQDGSWSANFPICVLIVMCPPPVTPAGGAIQPASGPFNEGAMVIFSCSQGFQLKGVPAVTCQADGTWTEQSPICSQEFCQQPVVPTNGQVNPTGQIASGSSVIFECDRGFRIDGTREVVCTQLLQWSNPSPLCVEVTCNPPPPFVGGNFEPASDAYALGDEITFSCKSGFILTGETPTVTCNLQGDNAASWSSTIPSCVEEGAQCPALTRPAFGIIVPPILTAYPVGEKVEFRCDDGYGIMGNNELICTRDGSWSAEIPVCEIETPSCPVPNVTSNLIVRPQEGPYDVGLEIRFSCENGFNIKGEESAICTKALRWSEIPPTCSKSENNAILSEQDLEIVLYAAVPSAGLILLVILCCCCVCCCRKRRRDGAETTEDLIMSYRKENTTFPSGQGTEIYNIYGGRDNRPLAPMRESHHHRSANTSNNLDHNTHHHQYEHHYAENPLLNGTLESHRSLPMSTQSSHQSSNLPAAESSGHYANVDESLPPTMDRNDRPSKRRRQQQENPAMNQLTRL